MRFEPPESDRSQALQAVRAAIEAVEASGCGGQAGPRQNGGPEPVRTGWSPLDAAGGGLARGAVHEWLEGEWIPPRSPGGEEERHPEERRNPAAGGYLAGTLPMGVAIHLARCAAGDTGQSHGEAGAVAWIGRRCWPNPRALVAGGGSGGAGEAGGADHALLARSLFVDPPDRAARLWAIDLALRSSAVAAVVADGSGLDMASTRRLQLAARNSVEAGAGGGGGFCLLLRPAADRKALSAAQTRWLVRPAPTDEGRCARWMIELLRRKGPAPAASSGSAQARQPLRFIVEWDHEAGAVIVAPEVVSRRLASKLQRAG